MKLRVKLNSIFFYNDHMYNVSMYKKIYKWNSEREVRWKEDNWTSISYNHRHWFEILKELKKILEWYSFSWISNSVWCYICISQCWSSTDHSGNSVWCYICIGQCWSTTDHTGNSVWCHICIGPKASNFFIRYFDLR